jgi:5-methylcytosine-specific restriction endonuclease McrA
LRTKEQLERLTLANRKNTQDPEWRLKNLAAVPIRIAALKEKWKDPIFRAQQIEERKARYANIPNYRERCNLPGSKASNWRGGISFEKYSSAFNNILKERIRERDGHVCQICGIHEDSLKEKLSIHHIDFTKNHNMDSNLVSLCRSCHLKLTPRKSFNKFFVERLNWVLSEEELNKIYYILEV